MMENVEKILEIFFRRVPPHKILEGQEQRDQISEEEFVRLMRTYINQYSENELRNMFSYLTANFFEKYYATEEIQDNEAKLDVFSLLRCYSRWILKIQGNEIVCEYSKLFQWRRLSQELSEDLIVTAFLADREWEMPINRQDFGWKPFITHNNEELKKIVKEGICENHYHLKGSAPIFQLTWVSIMNNIHSKGFEERFREFDKDRRNQNINYGNGYSEKPFAVLSTQAALIRLFLVSIIVKKRITIGQYSDTQYDQYLSAEEYDRIWKAETERNVIYFLNNTDELMAIRGSIYRQIMAMRYGRNGSAYPDYALCGLAVSCSLTERRHMIFQGERWFLYEMMKSIYGGDPEFRKYRSLFYAYLVIRENVRAELIQINKKVGFENFRIYQDRKEFFLELPFYSEGLVREAVQSSLLDSNVVTLEARIAPKDTAKSMARQIEKLDGIVAFGSGNKDRIFYTLHFIKSGPDRYQGEIPVKCRHYALRQQCRKQSLAIADMREHYKTQARRIRGIDAANTEIGCGPEVFAQSFRFLAGHVVKSGMESENMPQLGMTYHVGEDFLDMVSGLRAIDEAVHFLNLTCGSRLGHALALGVDVDEWYNFKNYRVIIPQQEYLDNIAWMYHMLEVLRIPDESEVRDFLRREFRYYFDLIYRKNLSGTDMDYICAAARNYYHRSRWEKFYYGNLHDFNIDNYYYAWTLRGDAPELYAKGFFENGYNRSNTGNKFVDFAVNRNFPRKQHERYFPEVGVLYHLYHFNPAVRKEGEKCIEVKVKPFWSCIVSRIQKLMQRKIAEYGIGIETNPTSNYLIGTFKRYEKHPILNFYNQNLVTDTEKLENCPQISVSINTDDQGVFNTSLENEYAYMALALEQLKDEKGKPVYNRAMVYQWLDSIRKMGIRQTFLSNDEIYRAFEARKMMEKTRRDTMSSIINF